MSLSLLALVSYGKEIESGAVCECELLQVTAKLISSHRTQRDNILASAKCIPINHHRTDKMAARSLRTARVGKTSLVLVSMYVVSIGFIVRQLQVVADINRRFGFYTTSNIDIPSESSIPRQWQVIPIDPQTRKKAGILTTRSLCRMARWIYTLQNDEGIHPRDTECLWWPQERMLHNSSEQLLNTSQLAEGDTVFVPFTALRKFVDNMLNNITVNIAVFSGQSRVVPPANQTAIDKIINHPHVLRWFCMNLPVYGGTNPHHPKVSPFPYGLVDVEWYSAGIYAAYTNVFFESLSDNSTVASTVQNKSDFIFAGPISKTQQGRSGIPQTKGRLPPPEFFKRIANSRYILSPNGDRPECYRHYEAIGLGTMPITELDPILFRHFGSNVIYNTSDWNLTAIEAKSLDRRPHVNRNLIRESYWMEWANSEAGVGLNWNSYENGQNGLTLEQTELLLSMDAFGH